MHKAGFYTLKQKEMKHKFTLLILILGITLTGFSQKQLNLGAGYYGENGINPGVVFEMEYEKFISVDLSTPLKANLGYHNNPEYHAVTIDLHKGFRRYYSNGLFIEQYLGLGLIRKTFSNSNYQFQDNRGAVIFHGNKPVTGIMPSVTVGVGYDFSANKDHSAMLWIRPKVYWDLGYRPLNLPNAALQIGFTKTIKKK